MSTKRYFSKIGFEIYKKRIERQKARASRASRQVGKEAGDSCDWHDNFGYEEARRQAELENRLLGEMQANLHGATVFEPPEQNTAVRIGNTVLVLDENKNEKKTITIGAFGETDTELGLVSYESPLADALMGLQEGEVAEFYIEDHQTNLAIIQILPPSHTYIETLNKLKERSV